MTYSRVDLSGADPVGVLFFDGKTYLRGIEAGEVDGVKKMFDDGLISALEHAELIPPVIIFDGEVPEEMRRYELILQHKAISPIIYPREWSFQMTKAVALAYLEIARIASSKGYYLKDCHVFNFVFNNMQPVWVDIGSFVKKENEGIHPFPVSAFKSSVLTPLKIWSDGAPLIGSSVLASPGKQLTEKESYVYHYPFARKSLLMRRALSFMNRWLDKIGRKIVTGDSKLFRKYKRKVERLNINGTSNWKNYHTQFVDQSGSLVKDPRFEKIIQLIEDYKPSSILELAGNAGVLSEMILERVSDTHVICTDYDSLAIDSLYQRLGEKDVRSLHAAKLNFMVTEYSCDELKPEDRFKSDCVLALAVTHHLLLTQGYSYRSIFEKVKKYVKSVVFIEYMPLGLWNGQTAPPLPDWYSQEAFENEFVTHFELLRVEKLDVNRVLFIGQPKT